MNISDVVIKPGDSQGIECYRYVKDGKHIRRTALKVQGYDYWLRGTAETQLFHLLGFQKREVESFQEYSARNVALQNAFNSREEPIMLRMHEGKVIAAVSPDYIHIDFEEVEKAMMKVTPVMHQQTCNLRHKEARIYRLEECILESEGVEGRVMVLNSYEAQSSLRLFQYYNVVICTNGLIRTEEKPIFTHIHKGNISEILDAFSKQFSRMVESMDIPTELIKTAKTMPFTQQTADLLNANELLSKKLRLDVFANKPQTVWDMVMALTSAIKEKTRSMDVRMNVEREAYRLMNEICIQH